MGQSFGKAKQGEEQKTDKDAKAVPTSSNDAKALIKFMEENYNMVEKAENFDDFYHAIYKMIEMFCANRGQLQYKIPPKEDLQKAYEDVKAPVKKGRAENLTRDEFIKLTEKIVDTGSFHVGRGTIQVLMVLFGAPACALLAKRIVPGLNSFSDDVVIPVATSGAVVYLAKTNKL